VSVLGLLVLVKTFLSRTLAVEIEGCWPWQPQKDEWHQPPTFKGGIRSALSCRSALAVAACQGACGQVIRLRLFAAKPHGGPSCWPGLSSGRDARLTNGGAPGVPDGDPGHHRHRCPVSA
jgi:hypothetical protein